jgi:hypothetical protein
LPAPFERDPRTSLERRGVHAAVDPGAPAPEGVGEAASAERSGDDGDEIDGLATDD